MQDINSQFWLFSELRVYISQFWIYNMQLRVIKSKLWEINSQLYEKSLNFNISIYSLNLNILRKGVRIERKKKSELRDVNSQLRENIYKHAFARKKSELWVYISNSAIASLSHNCEKKIRIVRSRSYLFKCFIQCRIQASIPIPLYEQ